MEVCSRLVLYQFTYSAVASSTSARVLQAPPGSFLLDQLGLVQADRGFHQRVVQRVPDGADRGVDAGLDQVGGEGEAGVHLGPVRRDADARRACGLGRAGRRCLRQRPGGNDHRAVQDRVHPGRVTVPHRSIATLADLEEVTSAWVHWYNTQRPMHRLWRTPPAEAAAGYYHQAAARPGRAA